MSVRFETARLVVRSFTRDDADAWLEMVNEPDFGRFLPPSPPKTHEDFEAMVERRDVMERERGFAMWAVDERERGAFVGQCGFYPAHGADPNDVELAYHFNKASWNKGYATEAARAVLAYGLGPVGLERVVAFVMPENIASRRVADKAGMRFEGHVTAYEIEGLMQYAATRASWTAAGQSEP